MIKLWLFDKISKNTTLTDFFEKKPIKKSVNEIQVKSILNKLKSVTHGFY